MTPDLAEMLFLFFLTIELTALAALIGCVIAVWRE